MTMINTNKTSMHTAKKTAADANPAISPIETLAGAEFPMPASWSRFVGAGSTKMVEPGGAEPEVNVWAEPAVDMWAELEVVMWAEL
jgi:hypothetical protein